MTVFFFNRLLGITSAMAVAILVFWVSAAPATTSRINSLGGSGDYFEDDANVLRWYGSLADYPDQVMVESGNFNIPDGYWLTSSQKVSGPGIGVHYALGQDSRFGTVAIFYHDHNDDRSFSLAPEGLRNNLSFLYAFDLGPLTAAAFFGHGSRKMETAEIDYSANTVGIGTRMDLSESAYLDLVWESQFTNLQSSSFSDAGGSNSESNFNLRGRAFIALGQRSAIVPVAEVIHEDRLRPFPVPVLLENHLTRLGCGLNYFPDTDHLLLLNAEYVDGRRKTTFSDSHGEDSWTAWSLKAGFESRVLSWLTTRGSIGFVDYQLDSVLDAGRKILSSPDPESPALMVNLGFSIHLGPGDLDFGFGEKYPEPIYIGEHSAPQKPWLSATARFLF